MKPRLLCGGSWPLLFGLLVFLSSPLISEATCPTRFYAQAITPARAAEIDVYFSRAQIPNAADCATLCGRRDFCKSAVFNHDSKSCALSYDIVVECKKKTERYNTFHLTSEGADSISLLSCVDLCDKEKNQFQGACGQEDGRHAVREKHSFSRNEAPKVVQKSSDLTTRTQEAADRSEAEGGGGGLRGHGDRGSFITLTRGVAAKTVGGSGEQQPTGEAPSNAILEALQRLMKTVDSQLQNSTADRPGAVIHRVGAETTLETEEPSGKKPKQRGETSSESPAVTREFGAQIFDLPDLRQTAKAEERREEAAIKGAEAKHKAEDEEAKRKKADAKKELAAADLITTATGHKRVAFHAAPLGIQEVFNGTTNSSSSGRGHVFKTGGQADTHRGGFFAWLQPGERLQLPPDFKLPPELATLAPELFALASSNETADGSAPSKKTITRFAKISVAPGDPKGTATVREVFDKNGASIPIGGEKKSNESETKTAESMDPVVVNGRLLSADEIRSLLTREQSTTTTTTTPKPWKPASQLFGASDEDEEDSSETTTTEKPKKKKVEDSSASDSSASASNKRNPHRRPQHDEKADGFLNTFLISGISSMIHGADGKHTKEDEREEANEKIRLSRLGTSSQSKSRPAFPAESQENEVKTSTRPPPTTSTTALPTTTPFVLQTTTTASGPIVCYRQIPQQILLYAAFETIHDISLNECRCRCAQTWLNMTVGPKCKSVLYNEVNRECSLNQGDHNGKYDLIYDKFVDYHYVSCDIKYLLSAAKRVCSRILPTMNLFFARPKLPSENRTEEAGADDSQPMNSSEQKRAKDPKIAALGIAKIDELENPVEKQTSKRIESTSAAPSTSTTTEPSTTSTTPVPSTTTTKADDLLIQEVTYTTANTRPPLFSSTTFFSTASTGGGDDSDLLIQEVRSTAASDASASTDAAESTARTVSTKWKEESVATSTVPSTTTTSYDILTISGHTDRCFEVIPGFMMRSTAGGLEHNVTMSECECHCANSLNSKRYSFQCLSATYYHNERDCVLNLDSRELSTELFMKSAPEENVSYLGLICNQGKRLTQKGILQASPKAVEQHTRKGECPRAAPPPAPSTTTTTTERTTTLAVHTDNCFLELPHYVLEGTALAVESNVTVDECKCFCVDSAHRYGSECQSVEYYYDTQTCLLNKENRVSDPDRFNYEPHGVLHSYFDYRCHSEKMILSVYVEQVCRKFIDVRIDEIEPTSSSLDVDDEERENEVRLVTQTQLPYGSKEVLTFGGRRHKAEEAEKDEKPRRWVKTLKFVNEDEDATTSMPLGLSPIEPEAKKEAEDDGEDLKGAKADGREQDEDESDEEETEERRSSLTQRRPRTRQRHRDPAGQQSEANESEENEEAVERKRKRKLRNEQKQKAAKSTSTTTTTTEEPPSTTEELAESTEVEAESSPTTTEEPSTTTTEEAAHSTIVQSADSEESVEQTPLPPLPPPTTTKPRAGRRGNIAEIEELEGEEELKKWEATSTTTAAPTTPSTTTTQATTTTRPKPRSTSPVSTTTSTTTTTTTSRPYLPVGNCRYSALYQTAFNGERLIRRFRVQTALQCFSGCHWERCRSANLIHTGGSAKFCELYRDSIVDFRRTDVLYFDRDTVHFDSIHCQEA
ncbi:hypothetical protein M3Y99_00825900 [Aphelenchoides fujianensis]|nr:hypothetical protein M3Y99_00825900 [Aphelenchoides fujianensis]